MIMIRLKDILMIENEGWFYVLVIEDKILPMGVVREEGVVSVARSFPVLVRKEDTY